MEVSNIQTLINNKAEAKLNEDIKSISDVLYNGLGYNLLKGTKAKITKHDKEIDIDLCFLLTNDGLKKEVFNANIDKYIQKETKDFLDKVESIREDVDYLLDNVR